MLAHFHPVEPITVDELSSAERFLLWSLRLALSPSITSEEAQPALVEGFKRARIPDALRCFMDMSEALMALWYETRHVPEIHCTCCKGVAAEEWCLLEALAALQVRDIAVAGRKFAQLLPRSGVRIMLDYAARVADAFGAAGWALRARLTEPAADKPALNVGNEHQMLH